ncbi:hypothetical protein BI347_06750 [Chromobacterium sphagni]|uniref:Uncharacterized protein n=1 Tax=Chromobacterium sphagni TaxID=1903179 RepID=A0A1S1X237_9NEIS|nr:hypothetical protein [Chromobacterium sphagni]OHX13236.1 hypothetical protein BI347_06750 [Chromobacterium sphagni]
MQSNSVIIAVLLSLATLAGGPATAQAVPSAAAQQVAAQERDAAAAASRGLAQFARQTLQDFGGRLPEGFPLDVARAGDLAAARVGPGFPLYSVDPQKLLTGGDISQLMAPTGSWRFVIYLQQRPLGLVTVERVAGRWEAVAYGAAGLAKSLESLQAAYGNAARSNTRFVRVYQAQADFLEVTPAGGGKPRFAALNPAYQPLQRQAAGAGANGLLDSADFIESLRATVRSNLSNVR